MLEHRCKIPMSDETKAEIKRRTGRNVEEQLLKGELLVEDHAAWMKLYYREQPKQSLKWIAQLEVDFPQVAAAALPFVRDMLEKLSALEAARAAEKLGKAQRQQERKAKSEDRKALRGVKVPVDVPREIFDLSRATLRAAIQPQFPEYKKQIYLVLFNRVDRLFEKLDNAKGDAKAASVPEGKTWKEITDHNCRRSDYLAAQWARESYAEICKWTISRQPHGGSCDTDFRVRKSADVIEAALLTQAHAITERDFDTYSNKLAGKIGQPIERATVIGKLWQNSILLAHIEAGFWNESKRQPFQRWSTKMILNTSCLGKLFNQWPTRRIA